MQIVQNRPNLTEVVADNIREMILDGSLAAGRSINEVQLAANLGVSRTPVREALSRLISEGALEEIPRRGYFVQPLSAAEVRQIYPIRSILDPAALELAGIPSREAIAELRCINAELDRCQDPKEAVRLDDLLHLRLIEKCPNHVLKGLIQQFMWRTRRYELGLMRHRVGMPGGVAANERIFVALEHGDLEGACSELRASMLRGQKPVLEWLSATASNKRG
jgi:DNA-binding GntR family transcriptional regulator